LVSHQLFIKRQAPGDSTPLEILGVDWWCDSGGMTEHYNDATHMASLGGAFTGRPQTSVWEQPAGFWSEW
jgi:hypothetical protein